MFAPASLERKKSVYISGRQTDSQMTGPSRANQLTTIRVTVQIEREQRGVALRDLVAGFHRVEVLVELKALESNTAFAIGSIRVPKVRDDLELDLTAHRDGVCAALTVRDLSSEGDWSSATVIANKHKHFTRLFRCSLASFIDRLIASVNIDSAGNSHSSVERVVSTSGTVWVRIECLSCAVRVVGGLAVI